MNKLFAVALVIWMAAGVAPAGAQDRCDRDDPTLVKPDLVALPPRNVRVIDWGGTRRVVFTTTIANVGDADLVLRGEIVRDSDGTSHTRAWQKLRRADGSACDLEVGEFELHPSHNHWHFEDFVDYEVRRDDPFTGEVVARSEKVSFCLLDLERLPGYSTPQHFLTGCASQGAVQGISVGFADVYESGLPGQFVDLDADPARPVPAGTYYLVNVANPTGRLEEKLFDRRANAGVVSFTVFRGPPTPPPTTTPTATLTPPLPTRTPTLTRTSTPAPPTATPVPPTATRTPRVRPSRPPRPEPTPRPTRPPRPTRIPGPKG